jgi:cellulose synthase/poly-beta-1,6-N-acetylglucosamine synthase-like glycosyltransferase
LLNTKELLPKTEKKWIFFFVFFIGLWGLVLLSTLLSRITGQQGLVDYSVDLSVATIPLLGIIILYTMVNVFVFVAYFFGIRKAKAYQKKLCSSHILLSPISEGKGSSHSDIDYHPAPKGLCTIIIPSRNEESVIRRTVTECLNQTYRDIEVVVVCHNCTDRTFQEANIDDDRVRVFDLKTKESGKGIALNYGVQMSKGKYLLILDGDALLSPSFIELALPMFKDNYAAVQGKYSPSNRNYNTLTKLLAVEGDLWSTPFMTVRGIMEKRCPLGGTGYIIRKDALMDVGLFDNHLVDDYELTFRLLRKKYRIAFAPLCIDYDEKPPTLDIMLRQRSRWAKGFLSLLTTKVPESSDILGHISWLWPIAAIAGLIMLFIPAYAQLHFMIFEYYPYTYSYLSLNVWIILTVLIYALQAAVLVNEHGIKGLKYALYLPLYNMFSQYCFVSYIKAFFIKSWANTKTQHGFTRDVTLEKEIQSASVIQPDLPLIVSEIDAVPERRKYVA